MLHMVLLNHVRHLHHFFPYKVGSALASIKFCLKVNHFDFGKQSGTNARALKAHRANASTRFLAAGIARTFTWESPATSARRPLSNRRFCVAIDGFGKVGHFSK